MTGAVLTLEALTIGYRTSGLPNPVAGPIDLTLRRGELTCLLGPNGAGKSTLMRTLAAMQPPLSGVIRLNGRRLSQLTPAELARDLAVVLTERVTVGLLSVYDLVALGRHPHTDWTGRLCDGDHDAIERAMEAAGATTLAGRLVGELSDGERQRVMVARALAQEPSIMILDEITAFLDMPRRVEIMQLLVSLAHEQGRTILVSTHDLELALQTADRLWLLADGRLRHGVPERLGLDGAFDEVFDSGPMHFDRHRGTFRMRRAHRGPAVVSGDSLEALWTRRALERYGFDVTTDGRGRTGPHVTVQGGAERHVWITRHPSGLEQTHDSLEALLIDIGRPTSDPTRASHPRAW